MKTLGTAVHNRSTVETWYHQHGAALLLFGIALTGDRGCAQDAMHQIFLKLLEHPNLGQIATVRTYLFSSLRNTIQSYVNAWAETWRLNTMTAPDSSRQIGNMWRNSV